MQEEKELQISEGEYVLRAKAAAARRKLEKKLRDDAVAEIPFDEIFKNGSPVNDNVDGTFEAAMVGLREKPVSFLPPPKGRRRQVD